MKQLLNHNKCKKWAIILSFFIMFSFLSGCKNTNLPSNVSKSTPTPPIDTQKPIATKTPVAAEMAPTPTPMPEILKPDDVIVEIKQMDDNVDGGVFSYFESEFEGYRKYGANEKAGSKEEFQIFVAACENFFRRHGMGILEGRNIEMYVDPIFVSTLMLPEYYERPSLSVDWLLLEDLYYLISDRYANAGLVRGLTLVDAHQQGMEIPNNVTSINKETVKEILLDISNDEFESWKLAMDAQAFSPVWSSEERIAELNELSFSYASYLVDHLGWRDADEFSALSAEVTTKSDEYSTVFKNDWLAFIGSAVRIKAPIDVIRFPNSAVWFTFKDPELYEDDFFLTRNLKYQYNRNYFVVLGTKDDDTGFYRECLVQEEEKIDKVKEMTAPYYHSPKERIEVYLDPESTLSYALPEYDTIYLSTSGVVVHEYAHIITAKTDYLSDNRWGGEGLATYLDVMARTNSDDLSYYLKSVSPGEYEDKIRRAYCKLYNVEAFPTRAEDIYLGFQVDFNAYFDMYNSEDYGDHFESLFENQSEDSIGLTYNSAASLIHYIIRNYGEDKFFAIYKDYDRYEEILGKSHAELRAEWENYMLSAFEGYFD